MNTEMLRRSQDANPIRELLEGLPRLPTAGNRGVDFPAADEGLLVSIADSAEITIKVVHRGISGIGTLLSQSSVAIKDGAVDAESVAAIGALLVQLSELAAGCTELAARCRQQTFDFSPATA